MHTVTNRRSAPRTAFTLIELLIVIAIIALLVTLSAGGYQLVMRTQRQKNTELLIDKLQLTLNQQRQSLEDQIRKGTYRLQLPFSYLDAAGGDRNRAIALWLHKGGDTTNGAIWKTIPSWLALNGGDMNKASGEPPLLMQEFPTNFDVLWLNPGLQSQLRAQGATGLPGAIAAAGPIPPNPPPSEGAACLLLALSFSRGTGVLRAEDLEPGAVVDQPDLKSDNTGWRPADGIKELRDAWGDPLRFAWQLNPQTGQLEAVISSVNPK